LNEQKETSSRYGLEGHDGVAKQPSAEENLSMSTITTGVELAKTVLSVCEMDGTGRVLRRQNLQHEVFWCG